MAPTHLYSTLLTFGTRYFFFRCSTLLMQQRFYSVDAWSYRDVIFNATNTWTMEDVEGIPNTETSVPVDLGVVSQVAILKAQYNS